MGAEQEKELKEKKVLYVERNYLEGENPEDVPIERYHNSGYASYSRLCTKLRDKYNLICFFNLDEKIPTIIADTPCGSYDALMTHLPFESPNPEEPYKRGLELLTQIKDENPNLPVLVYSGMSPKVHGLVYYYGADEVLKKSGQLDNDFPEIDRILTYFLTEYQENYQRREEIRNTPPQISSANGITNVRAVVNIRRGIGMVFISGLFEQCKSYQGNVFLSSIEDDSKKVNLRDKSKLLDYSGLLDLSLYEGSVAEVSIEGDNEESRKLARKLYAGITSMNENKMDFDRFE